MNYQFAAMGCLTPCSRLLLNIATNVQRLYLLPIVFTFSGLHELILRTEHRLFIKRFSKECRK